VRKRIAKKVRKRWLQRLRGYRKETVYKARIKIEKCKWPRCRISSKNGNWVGCGGPLKVVESTSELFWGPNTSGINYYCSECKIMIPRPTRKKTKKKKT